MKKITLIAALLGAAYFSNAQVGIGTPEPNASAMLDIDSANKGVLIPRVTLTSYTSFSPVTGNPVNSLLIYNNATIAGVPGTSTVEPIPAITPGFYYWFDGKWERIVSQTQLDRLIQNSDENTQNLDDIINLLQTAYPSNNINGNNVFGETHGGGLVYTPGREANDTAAAVPPKFEFVYYNAGVGNAPGEYLKKDVTEDFSDFIKANESKTFIVQTTNKKYQYFISEKYLETNPEMALLPDGTIPTGLISLANTWLTTPQGATQAISIPTGVYLIDVANGFVNNFEAILGMQTNFVRVQGDSTTPTTYHTIQEYIELLGTTTANVGYTTVDIPASGGQAAIPAGNFYSIHNGVKTLISLTGIVYNGITNFSNEQVDVVKTKLGDNFSSSTLVKTGDTWIDNKPIFKAVIDATVLGGTANLSNRIARDGNTAEVAGHVTINGDVTNINVIGIRIIGANGVTASATDLSVEASKIYFRIGTGSMYNVLSANDLNVKVLVEFSATTPTPTPTP